MSRAKTNKTDVHSVLDGLAEIYRVKYSGKIFQFRYYEQSSKKHFRKTLRTTDLETALIRARDLAIDIVTKKKANVPLFGEKLTDLIDEYIIHRQRDVNAGRITKARLGTIKTILKKLPQILGENCKVTELDENTLFYYFLKRKELYPNVKIVTVRNEQPVINAFVKHFYRLKRFPFPEFFFEPIKMNKDDIGTRDTFTPQEYKKLTHYFKTFCSKKSCGSNLELRERNIVRNYILILANTGLRVGELKQLKWSDIKEFESAMSEDGYETILARFVVRGETSKVRATREITVRGGEYFKRLKGLKVEGDDNDLIIPHLPHRTYQKNWYKLMEAIEIYDHKQRNLTYYSLRHYFITLMVSKGENVANIAKITGTSINHIENTYLKFNQSMSRSAALSSIKSQE